MHRLIRQFYHLCQQIQQEEAKIQSQKDILIYRSLQLKTHLVQNYSSGTDVIFQKLWLHIQHLISTQQSLKDDFDIIQLIIEQYFGFEHGRLPIDYFMEKMLQDVACESIEKIVKNNLAQIYQKAIKQSYSQALTPISELFDTFLVDLATAQYRINRQLRQLHENNPQEFIRVANQLFENETMEIGISGCLSLKKRLVQFMNNTFIDDGRNMVASLIVQSEVIREMPPLLADLVDKFTTTVHDDQPTNKNEEPVNENNNKNKGDKSNNEQRFECKKVCSELIEKQLEQVDKIEQKLRQLRSGVKNNHQNNKIKSNYHQVSHKNQLLPQQDATDDPSQNLRRSIKKVRESIHVFRSKSKNMKYPNSDKSTHHIPSYYNLSRRVTNSKLQTDILIQSSYANATRTYQLQRIKYNMQNESHKPSIRAQPVIYSRLYRGPYNWQKYKNSIKQVEDMRHKYRII